MLDDILTTADKLVHGDRNDHYGEPIDDYSKVVAIYKTISGIDLDPEEGALFMLAVKLARLATNFEKKLIHRDSLVDAAGYLWVFASICEAQNERAEHPTYGIVK